MPTHGRTASTAVLFLSVAASLAGCTTPMMRQADLPAVGPPQETVHIKQATEKIKPGDMLQFRLPDEPAAPINGLYQVAEDGRITLRGEGHVQVAGKTLDEARQMLRGMLSLPYAMQTMELTPYEYYLVGAKDDEVKKVVRIALSDGVTVKDALSGRGVPPLGDKVIWVNRPGRTSKVAGSELLRVDWHAIGHGDNATNYKLRCGDYLFVADKQANALQRLLDPGLSPPSGEK